ncbi:WD40 repeat-like protein [Polychaeton citri CBS 116435]|uniref:WD40 repeat-like protein n=1 Tax=Polychaeton citri CBS 116435 TaxID=1314669 RepID=A0A9P4Q6P7_9PEZI|nr:WD40 repeat-like protein [Polychaeton citri CBS 116435]
MSKQYLQTHTIVPAENEKVADIFSVAITPAHLFAASGSSSIRIYSTKGQTVHADTAEDEQPYPLAQTLEKAHPLGAHHVATSLDGKTAATSGFGGEVKLWSLDAESGVWTAKGELVPEDRKNTDTWALALTESGQYMACTSHDGRIRVYDVSSIAPTNDAPTALITTYETKGSFALAIDISPDGEMTSSGHANGSIYVFNNSTKKLAHSLAGLVNPVRAVRFSPANRYLAAAGDSRIIALYDTKSGEQIANLTGHSSWIMGLDWNWSGEFLLSGAYDGKAKVWSVERRECVATQTESEGSLWAVRWLHKTATARNETFVTAGTKGRLAFYREASGT